MVVRVWGLFPAISLCVILGISTAALGQRVTIDDISIVRKENGYAISGNIIAEGLNPAGKTVIADNVTVLAEIRLENDSEYPILPDSKSSPQPQWAQTPYRIGSSYLTSKQMAGRDIQTFTIAKMNMRESPVWKIYGGQDKWRASAPEKVQAKFESLIPLQYGNRPMRVRATLEQSYVTDKPGTGAAALKHDTIQILPTLEMHAESVKNLYPSVPENKPSESADSNEDDSEKPETSQPAKPTPKADPQVVFEKRMELISQITTVRINKPELLKNVQKNFFRAREEYLDDETQDAKRAYIAWHRKLITTVMHTAIIQPESLGDIQLDYLRIAR